MAMSPFQVETMLDAFRRIHVSPYIRADSETLSISEDGRQNARERVRMPDQPKPPGWVEPRQILALIADRSPTEPAVDYEMQRRAGRFMASARPPRNPLPPFDLVRDHGGKTRKRKRMETPAPEIKDRLPSPPQESPPPEPELKPGSAGVSPACLKPGSAGVSPACLIQPLEPDLELMEPLAGDAEELEEKTGGTGDRLVAPTDPPPDVPRPAKKPEVVTAAKLFEDIEVEEEDEDFDDEEGLRGEEADESDVVFGSGPITQASMMEFMRKYPDSVIKFLLRRNLDGRPLPHEFESIYNQWQERGLLRGRLKRNLLRMMDWEEIPDLPIHELVGQIRGRVLDQRLSEE